MSNMSREFYLANSVDPVTGNLRSFGEIHAAWEAGERAANQAQALAADARAAADTRTDLEKSVALRERMYQEARRNGDTASAKYWKSQLDDVKDKRAVEAAKEARDAAFANDPLIKCMREEAGLIARSGPHLYPNASAEDLQTLVAIAANGSYPDPKSQWSDFKALSEKLTSAELEAERIKSSDAQIEAAKQNAELAESRVRQIELEQARARRESVE